MTASDRTEESRGDLTQSAVDTAVLRLLAMTDADRAAVARKLGLLPSETESHGELTMARFITYSTYDNEDVRGMSESEYRANGLPDDWDEYVWTEADSLSEAIALHDQSVGAYHLDLTNGREPQHTY